jgi:predicted NBD/HSP70 family sugar kinase
MRQAAELMAHPAQQPLTAAAVFRAARLDPALGLLVRRFAGYYARAIQWLVMSYDVERVVIGGGVASGGPAFLEPVLAELARWRAESPLAAQMLGADKVMLAPAGFNAGAWGALILAQESLGRPDRALKE